MFLCKALDLPNPTYDYNQAKEREKKIGDHRHRMTEQEEDEELLTDLNTSKKNVISFQESPHYVKNGIMRDYQIRGRRNFSGCFKVS